MARDGLDVSRGMNELSRVIGMGSRIALGRPCSRATHATGLFYWMDFFEY